MATKEQLAKLNADNPATIVERLSGDYIYPGAISPMRTTPIEKEAAREIERLRAENERLQKDAERYRAARDASFTTPFAIVNKNMNIITGEECDAYIDAAMSALPDTKGE